MATQIPSTTFEEFEAQEVQQERLLEKKALLSPAMRYVLRRIGLYLITLWGSISASFIFIRLIPGDPIRAMVAQMQLQGGYNAISTSQSMSDYYEKQFGLKGSLLEQYLHYMNRVLLHFDFGPSLLSYPNPALDLVKRGLPWTIALVGTSLVISWILGVIMGALVGWARKSKWADTVNNISLGLSHIPAYFVAVILLFIFAYRIPIFPANSAYNASLKPGWSFAFIWSVIEHMALPVIATVLVFAASWLNGTRALVIQILGEDYLTFASAKGLKNRQILLGYVMKNAWLPQISALALSLGAIINGNVLVESLFRYPGVGQLLVMSTQQKDVNTMMAIVTILIVLTLTANLIVDLLLPIFDPRISYSGK